MSIIKIASFGYEIFVVLSNETSETNVSESLIMSIMLYGAELRPVSITQEKKLEAARHKF